MISTVLIQTDNVPRGHLDLRCLLSTDILKVVGVASCVESGISMIEKRRPELVILDVEVPGGLGFDVFQQTRTHSYKKIILSETDRYAIKAQRYRVDDYLLKPAGMVEILCAIQKLLFQHKGYRIQQMFEDRFCKRALVRLSSAVIPTARKNHLVDLHDIVRIENQGTHRLVLLDDGVELACRLSMSRLMRRIQGNAMLRLSSTTAINLHHLVEVQQQPDATIALLSDGFSVEIPLHAEKPMKKKLAALVANRR